MRVYRVVDGSDTAHYVAAEFLDALAMHAARSPAGEQTPPDQVEVTELPGHKLLTVTRPGDYVEGESRPVGAWLEVQSDSDGPVSHTLTADCGGWAAVAEPGLLHSTRP